MESIILLIIFAFLTSSLPAEPLFQARVYRQHSNRQELLFLHYNERLEEEEKTILRHYYLRPDSSVATIDEVKLNNGEFASAQSSFLEVGEIGSVVRINDKMVLSFNDNGEIREKELDFYPDLLLGPLFNDHIFLNWDELMRFEKLYFKLPAPDVLKVATFYLIRDENNPYLGLDRVVFKMNVASFFLKFLIKPSYFVYDLNNRSLQEIHGTTILRSQENGKWSKTTDVEIYYKY